MMRKELQLPYADPDTFDKWSVFNAIGYEPLAWQRPLHEAEEKIRLLSCGVRVGKTFSAHAEGTAASVAPSKVSKKHKRWVGSRGWVVAPTYDACDKLFLQIMENLKRKFPWMIRYASERNRIIKLPHGGYVQGKSADNPDSLLSEELDWCIVDEAARVGETEINNLRQRLITRKGWMLLISSPTPRKWFRRDFERGQVNGLTYEFGEVLPGMEDKSHLVSSRQVKFKKPESNAIRENAKGYWSMRVPSHANPDLDRDTLCEWETTMAEIQFRQDVLSQFVGSDGSVFANADNVFVSQVVPRGEPGHRYAIGWDVARTYDHSVVSVVDYRTKKQVYLERFRGNWHSQLGRVIAIARRYNQPDIIGDATGNGDPVVERLKELNREAERKSERFASKIEGLKIVSNQIKRELIESLRLALEKAELLLLDDPKQRSEFELYEYQISETTGVIRYNAPRGFHDDHVIANALAWRLAGKPMGTALIALG